MKFMANCNMFQSLYFFFNTVKDSPCTINNHHVRIFLLYSQLRVVENCFSRLEAEKEDKGLPTAFSEAFEVTQLTPVLDTDVWTQN